MSHSIINGLKKEEILCLFPFFFQTKMLPTRNQIHMAYSFVPLLILIVARRNYTIIEFLIVRQMKDL